MIKGAVTQPTTTGELALDVLRQQATTFAEQVTQAQLGADPERVHDARVATRRMRAALRLFADALPSITGLDDELKWIASQLGNVRDLDVQLKRLPETAEKLGLDSHLAPYLRWLEQRRCAARSGFDDAFQSDRFIALTDGLRELNQLEPSVEVPVEDDAPRRLRRAYKKLRKRGDGLSQESPTDAFHRARIGGKRLRYAAEFFEPLYGKPARRLIDAATDVQDLLGDHQDIVVNRQRIDDAVRTTGADWPPETILALGQLIQQEAHHAEELRLAFASKYRDVKSAYRRLSRRF